ncbi:MAG: tetratricopeptide repeat protein, partial [Armatimonadota bacterium]
RYSCYLSKHRHPVALYQPRVSIVAWLAFWLPISVVLFLKETGRQNRLRAVAEQQQNKDVAALASYRHILAISPYSLRACRRIATLQLRMSRFADAERTYRKALSLQNSADDLTGLAEALVRQERFAETGPIFSKIVLADPPVVERWYPNRIEPQDISTAIEVATAEMTALWGAPDQALPHWRCALLMRPDNGRVWRSYGALLLQQGMLSNARIALKKAAHFLPNDPETIANLRALALYEGNKDKAIRLYEQALEANPQPDLEDWISQRLSKVLAPR